MSRTVSLLKGLALLAALTLCLQDGARAFEIFPRPEGQYTVQRGDTLYGIAGHYYSNPTLWPFLRNHNPGLKVVDTGGAPEKQPLTPGTKIDLHASRNVRPLYQEIWGPITGNPEDVAWLEQKQQHKGIPYDKKNFRFKLTSRPQQLWGYIVSGVDEVKTHLLERDLCYIRFRPSKKQAVLVGDKFGIYREKGPLYHPINPEREIGTLTEIVGEVEIVNSGHDLATAIVLDGYVEIVRGDRICLFTPREREIIPTKTHRMLTGTILYSASRETYYQENYNLEMDIVFIDRGECHGMKEGMLVNIYRASHPVADPHFFGRYLATPDRYVGEGMILKAFDKNSSLLVTRQREEIMPGDLIKSVSD